MTTAHHITRIAAPEGLSASPAYSHVTWGTGTFVAVSGQCAFDEHGEVVGRGDALAQARQVFANLARCLAAAGADFSDVVKLTYYVTDIAHMAAARTARTEALPEACLPASSAVQVSALVHPDLLLEIEAFAIVRTPE